MIPYLYKQTYHGTGNEDRIGPLPAWIECKVTEERNGEFFLEGTLPVGGRNTEELAVDRIIMAASAPPKSGGYLPMQPFRIRTVEKGNDVIAVTAFHVTYQLTENIIKPTASIQDESIQYIFDQLLNQSGSLSGFIVPPLNSAFHFVSDITLEDPIYPSHDSPVSVRAWLGGDDGLISMITGKISDQGEVLPEPEIEWNGWTISLKKHRGAVLDLSVAYARNMDTMDYSVNAFGLVTGYYGWWRGGTFTDCIVYEANSSDFAYVRVVSVDLSSEFETEPTQAQMEEYLEAYAEKLAANHLPTSITVTAVPDALQGVFLCDTITIIHPELKVKQTAKVVKTVYDVIRDRYDSITIGDIRPAITDTIAKMIRAEYPRFTGG